MESTNQKLIRELREAIEALAVAERDYAREGCREHGLARLAAVAAVAAVDERIAAVTKALDDAGVVLITDAAGNVIGRAYPHAFEAMVTCNGGISIGGDVVKPGAITIAGPTSEPDRQHPQAEAGFVRSVGPRHVPVPARSMLVIGETEADARDFVGDETTERPRKLAIPDEIWPRDETIEGVFCTVDTTPTGRAFDIIVVTSLAGAGLQRVKAVLAASARAKPGGVLWMEPAR